MTIPTLSPPLPEAAHPAPTPRSSRFASSLSLAVSLLVAACCAGLHLREALGSPFRVQDDARQHVFWTARYLDPGLFAGDPIADYFQAVAPPLYRFVYWLPAQFGVDPLTWSKWLPAFLGVAGSLVCWFVVLGFFRPEARRTVTAAVTAALAVALFNAATWLRDDLSSATPRAFYALLFLAFFGCWWRERRWPALLAVAAQGLIYPGTVFTSVGLAALGALRFTWKRPAWVALSPRRADWLFLVGVLVVAGGTLGWFSRQTAPYGPVLRRAEARTMPEMTLGGRSLFFHPNPRRFWFMNARSAVVKWPLRPSVLWLGFLLPVAVRAARRPTVATADPRWVDATLDPRLLPALGRLLAVSLGLFLCAHAFLFRLHLPNRYTEPTARAILPAAAALALVLGFRALQTRRARLTAAGIGVALLALTFSEVHLRADFPKFTFLTGTDPALYAFLRAQPAATRVATLSDEGSLLPTFARCGVFVDREFAVPYHLGYYKPFRARVRGLLAAHYSFDPGELWKFAQAHGITHFLLEPGAFDPGYVRRAEWLRAYDPEYHAALLATESPRAAGRPCVLAELAASAPAFRSSRFTLVSADEVRKLAAASPPPSR